MSTIITPDRSLDQRLAALNRANEIRFRRAALKRDLKQRQADALDLLIAPPPWIATMKVIDLLLAMPKVGRVKANRLLTRCRISPSKTIEGLSDRQRHELAALLWNQPWKDSRG